MADKPFIHLHTHSCYSLLDGAIPVQKLVHAAADMSMPALALTDHGNLFGAVEFYLAARKAGIKSIIGSEVYVTTTSKEDRSQGQKNIRHLLLLVKNLEGYRNLIRLSTMGYLEGFYYKPRIDHRDLENHSEGLIALTACLKGEIPQLLLEGREDEAEHQANRYREVFGRDSFFLEIQDHGMPEEKEVLPLLCRLAEKTGIPLAATNDAHYLRKEHAASHEILLSIATGKTIQENNNRFKFSSSENYFKAPEEMWELFGHIPQALENTTRIADLCDVELPMGQVLLPQFPLPKDHENLDDYLAALTRQGARQIYADVPLEVTERLEYELNVMASFGLSGYFLIVQDFLQEARRLGIPVGPGRGSAASSLVCFCLGITKVDPLLHGLTFERFLNPERVSMPDIDLDFCQERREAIIDYTVQKYGEDCVAHIASFGTLKARAAVKDVARVLGLPFDEADTLTKMVPERGDVSLDDALENNAELKRKVESNPVYEELFKHARVLEGIARHPSTHPAGIVVSPTALVDVAPLFRPDRDTGTIATTQYDMNSVEKIGLLKIDFLGLRTVTMIDECTRLVRDNRGKKLDLDSLSLDDAEAYALMSRGETVGLFQVESSGMTSLLKSIRPDSFRDIVAANALFRPGPMDWGNVYVECKHGRKKPEYPHAMLEPVLEETYGVLLFQEQVMKTAQVMAGFSAGQADELRRAMSKKDPESMDLARRRFVDGAVKRGVDQKVAERVYDQIQPFAGYAFNKAHSTAYALLIYQTAYLKAHYAPEFMTASLSSFVENTERLKPLLEECRRLDIEVLPPDVNSSRAKFTVSGSEIRYGLSAVKNMGRHASEAIVRARESDGPFSSLFDFTRRVELTAVTKQALESVAKAGAFDAIHPNRAAVVEAIPLAIEEGKRYKRIIEEGQLTIFEDQDENSFEVTEPALPAMDPWSLEEQLAAEQEALGFFLSGHPLDRHGWLFSSGGVRTPSELPGLREGISITVGGQVVRANKIHREGSAPFCFVDLEDNTGGRITAAVFDQAYADSQEFILPGSLLAVRGRLRRRKGELQVNANEVIPLLDILGRLSSLMIRVANDTIHEVVCPQLQSIFSDFPGKATVNAEVTVKDRGSVVVLLRNVEIEPCEQLVRSLEELPFVVGVEVGLGDQEQ